MAQISWERLITIKLYTYICGRCTTVEITILGCLWFNLNLSFTFKIEFTPHWSNNWKQLTARVHAMVAQEILENSRARLRWLGARHFRSYRQTELRGRSKIRRHI